MFPLKSVFYNKTPFIHNFVSYKAKNMAENIGH